MSNVSIGFLADDVPNPAWGLASLDYAVWAEEAHFHDNKRYANYVDYTQRPYTHARNSGATMNKGRFCQIRKKQWLRVAKAKQIPACGSMTSTTLFGILCFVQLGAISNTLTYAVHACKTRFLIKTNKQTNGSILWGGKCCHEDMIWIVTCTLSGFSWQRKSALSHWRCWKCFTADHVEFSSLYKYMCAHYSHSYRSLQRKMLTVSALSAL